ncbi:apolipoprotein N-acyltransferase [Streptomyces capparidis]
MAVRRALPVAVVAAGALPAPAFPEPSLWWLAYGALVPWMLLNRLADGGRSAALLGWLGGTGFVLAVHHWLLPDLHVFTPLVAALLGLLWAPWGWLVWRLLRGEPGPGRAAAAVALLPCGWLMAELVRSWEYLGGPWGLLGASQWQVGPALSLVSVGGVWLVGWLVVAVNAALAVALVSPAGRRAGAAGLVLLAVGCGAVWAWAPRPGGPGPGQDAAVRVAVVQPGVVHRPGERFARAEELTRQLAGKRADLVVWGESSVGFDAYTRPDLVRRLAALSRAVDAELLVNVDARRSPGPGGPGGGILKSAVLVDGEGIAGPRYDKRRLVPFGEYVPLRRALGWVTGLSEAAAEDRRRGTGPVLLATGAGRVGPLVCFESAFPDLSRELAGRGADLVVVQSSTSTFQGSWAPEQHASLAAVRAAETWRPVVHATLSGVSAVYDARGARVGPALGTGQRTAAVYEVPLASGTSPYTRLGPWVPWLAFASLAAAAAGASAARFRRRVPPGP